MSQIQNFQYKEEDFPVYVASPNGQPKGGLIVIHEIWALNDHTKSVADRYAAEGYVVVAPDLLTATEISKHAAKLQLDLFNPEKRNQAQPKLRALMTPMNEPGFGEKTLGKIEVLFDYLWELPEVRQKVAITGFCFGGSYSYNLAINEPRLKAALPFYGHAPLDLDELKKIQCPILAFYGEKDAGLMGSLPELKQLMHEAEVDFESVVYQDAGHAFFNDTNPFAYKKQAAQDSWKRSLQFLEEKLA